MPTLLNGTEVVTPSAADAALAQESIRTLAPHFGSGSLRLQVKNGPQLEELVLPSSAARLLLGILTEMGRGNAVSVAPIQAELTTNQAADLLNVSPPYLTKLLDDGALPFRMVGAHHRIMLQDVLAYRKETGAPDLDLELNESALLFGQIEEVFGVSNPIAGAFENRLRVLVHSAFRSIRADFEERASWSRRYR